MKRWLPVLPALMLIGLATAIPPASAARPTLTVTVVEDGLDIPWDIAFVPAAGAQLPQGGMLYTERILKKVTLRLPSGEKRTVLNNPAGMWESGETGLMAVEAARGFSSNREFLTCHGYNLGGVRDVRVVRWRLNTSFTQASFVRNVVTGLPATSGRHGGCALFKGTGQILYVGTGDAAVGRNPQNRTVGGGKVLRLDSRTGAPIKTNPYIKASRLISRQLMTYGHRNVQGLSMRSDGTLWAVEHGSGRDDEVNQLVRGGNYGWNPIARKAGDPVYNEGANSPMTDYALPGKQQTAKWSSGSPTVATSGAAFVTNPDWLSWKGALAVTALKDQSLRLMAFTADGKLRNIWMPAELGGDFGRLRAAIQGPDGSLYLSTSNGEGDDKILKVTP